MSKYWFISARPILQYFEFQNMENVRVVPAGDESGVIVQARFKEFLEYFRGNSENGNEDIVIATQQRFFRNSIMFTNVILLTLFPIPIIKSSFRL